MADFLLTTKYSSNNKDLKMTRVSKTKTSQEINTQTRAVTIK